MIPFCSSDSREARDQQDIASLRSMLRNSPDDAHVKFDCWDKADVERVKKLLTEEELRRVHFTWLEFRGNSPLSPP
jgi:hypothetical protein